jgi:hypothetical protein
MMMDPSFILYSICYLLDVVHTLIRKPENVKFFQNLIQLSFINHKTHKQMVIMVAYLGDQISFLQKTSRNTFFLQKNLWKKNLLKKKHIHIIVRQNGQYIETIRSVPT